MIDFSKMDDQTAEWILTTIARARAADRPAGSSELIGALAKQFQVAPSHEGVSSGDLARQALLVLAEDPETQLAIETMAGERNTGRRDRFDAGASMAIGIAAYFALSTAVEFERDKQGRWSFKLKVKPAGEAAVKKLVEKLVHYLPE